MDTEGATAMPLLFWPSVHGLPTGIGCTPYALKSNVVPALLPLVNLQIVVRFGPEVGVGAEEAIAMPLLFFPSVQRAPTGIGCTPYILKSNVVPTRAPLVNLQTVVRFGPGLEVEMDAEDATAMPLLFSPSVHGLPTGIGCTPYVLKSKVVPALAPLVNLQKVVRFEPLDCACALSQ